MSALTLVPQQEAVHTASSVTLMAITQEIQCLIDTADMVEEDSTDRADLDAQIAAFEAALPVKVDAVGYAFAHLESQIVMAKAERKRLQAREESIEHALERLEGYCIKVLLGLPEPKKGPRKLDGATTTLSLRPSEAVILTDEAAVPADYKTVVLEMPARNFERVVAAVPELPQWLTKQDLKVRLGDLKKALKTSAVAGADIEYRSNLKRS